MTAAFLLMTSAAMAGADPVAQPPAAAAPAPVVVSGAGCSNCGTPSPCDCGSTKVGLFDKLKARWSSKKSHDCCAPAPAPAPCDPCATAKPNLLDKLKGRWSSKKSHGCCAPACDPCGGTAVVPAAPPVTGGTTTPPKEMPKPPANPPKGGAGIPQPLPQVSGASGLAGSTSPY